MKKIYLFIFIGLISISCDVNHSGDRAQDWGNAVTYSDFLWNKYQPDTLFKTITISGDDFNKSVKLQLCEMDDGTGRYTPVSNNKVQLYANGNKCKNNILTISTNDHDKEIKLGILFSEHSEKGKHQWVLKLKDAGDIEILNGNPTTSTNELLIFHWEAKKVNRMNPLAFGFLLVVLAIVSLLFLWFLVLRPIFVDRFRIRTIEMENNEVNRRYNVKGALSITFSDKKLKQGFFERVFIGQKMFVQDSFFGNGNVTMVPRGRKGLTIRGAQDYELTQTVVLKDDEEPTYLSNESKQKYEIRII